MLAEQMHSVAQAFLVSNQGQKLPGNMVPAALRKECPHGSSCFVCSRSFRWDSLATWNSALLTSAAASTSAGSSNFAKISAITCTPMRKVGQGKNRALPALQLPYDCTCILLFGGATSLVGKAHNSLVQDFTSFGTSVKLNSSSPVAASVHVSILLALVLNPSLPQPV